MISSVLSGRSRPRGSGHTHRTARTGFVVGGCPIASESASIVVGAESEMATREMWCCRALLWRTASVDPLGGQK
jgi:hypothetical protein